MNQLSLIREERGAGGGYIVDQVILDWSSTAAAGIIANQELDVMIPGGSMTLNTHTLDDL